MTQFRIARRLLASNGAAGTYHLDLVGDHIVIRDRDDAPEQIIDLNIARALARDRDAGGAE